MVRTILLSLAVVSIAAYGGYLFGSHERDADYRASGIYQAK